MSVNVINTHQHHGGCLDYENCKYRKKIVDKLVEECTENVEEVKVAEITSAEHENVCKRSCIQSIVLFSTIFTINVDTYWYLFCLFPLAPKERYYSR